MPAFTQQTGSRPQEARKAWQESMGRCIDELRSALRQEDLTQTARRCGGKPTKDGIELTYWDRPVHVSWPELLARRVPEGDLLTVFDQAMLLYYLRQADGAPPDGRWIGFRDLPGGSFYNQAFQGYTGDVLGRRFGPDPDGFTQAALAAGGQPLVGLAPYAFTFRPLPLVRMAAVLWPGDEDFPARGQVLFDAGAGKLLIVDGLALLGSGLVHRLTAHPA